MSDRAIRHVARLKGLTPLEKALLFVVASHYREQAGRASPSLQTLSAETGMAPQQITRMLRDLASRGLAHRDEAGIALPALPPRSDTAPMPDDWQPSKAVIDELIRNHPLHSFDPEEAANDFRSFCQRRGIQLTPDERDRAFYRNIARLLARRQPGRVSFADGAGAAGPRSLYAFLSRCD